MDLINFYGLVSLNKCYKLYRYSFYSLGLVGGGTIGIL